VAQLKLTSLQRLDGQSDKSTETHECEFHRVNDGGFAGWEIAYDETENGVCHTVIRINKSRATVKRTGEYSSEMSIKPDLRNKCRISTPYGDIDMEITGISVNCGFDDNGGRSEFSYKSDVGGAAGSEITIILEVKN